MRPWWLTALQDRWRLVRIAGSFGRQLVHGLSTTIGAVRGSLINLAPLLILAVVAIVLADSLRGGISIRVSSVPEDLAKHGLSAEVVSARMRAVAMAISNDAAKNVDNKSCGDLLSLEGSVEGSGGVANSRLTEVRVPGSDISIDSLIAAVRRFFGWTEGEFVGELTMTDESYEVELRSDKRAIRIPRRERKELDQLISDAARQTMLEAAPTTFIMSLCNEPDKAVSAAARYVESPSADDKGMREVYALWAAIILKSGADLEAAAILKKGVQRFQDDQVLQTSLAFLLWKEFNNNKQKPGAMSTAALAIEHFDAASALAPADEASSLGACLARRDRARLLTGRRLQAALSDTFQACGRALECARHAGDREFAGVALVVRGFTLVQLGKSEQAILQCREAIRLSFTDTKARECYRSALLAGHRSAK